MHYVKDMIDIGRMIAGDCRLGSGERAADRECIRCRVKVHRVCEWWSDLARGSASMQSTGGVFGRVHCSLNPRAAVEHSSIRLLNAPLEFVEHLPSISRASLEPPSDARLHQSSRVCHVIADRDAPWPDNFQKPELLQRHGTASPGEKASGLHLDD
jgi:hypothetical protein